jgi:hypothetical protein
MSSKTFFAQFSAAIVCIAAFCGTANADFFIDNFTQLDDAAPGSTAIGSNGITVEVTDTTGTGTATTFDDVNNRYVFQTANIGDSFTVSYDWAGIFDDLLSTSANELTESPVSFFGDWTMTIDTGVGAPASYGPSIPTILPSAIALDNATELTYTFTYDGGSPFPFGGIGSFGGPANPLFATPEPTSLIMFGTAGLVLLSRRRRRQ